MGIIVQDNYELEGGVTIPQYYLNISSIKQHKIINSEDQSILYNIKFYSEKYANKEARYAGKAPFDIINISFNVDTLLQDMPSLYARCYQEVKLFYPNCIDDI
jgi:hypothetical protein